VAKLLLRVTEVADTLSLGRTKSYELIARGVIPSVRIDGAVRVPASALEDFVRSLPTTPSDKTGK
jgi:excisionase family DNA binding protein